MPPHTSIRRIERSVRRVFTSLLILTFSFSNLTFALPQDSTGTLAPYYISELLDEHKSDMDLLTRAVTPVGGKTVKDRVDEFGRAWVAKSAELLAAKMIEKVKGLEGKISLEDAERELIRQIKEWARKSDVPRYRKDKLIEAIEAQFAGVREARSESDEAGEVAQADQESTDERTSTSGVSSYELREIRRRMRALNFTYTERRAVNELLRNPQPILLFPVISDDTYTWGGKRKAFLPYFLRAFFKEHGIPFPRQRHYAEAWYGAHPGQYDPIERPDKRNMVSIAKVGRFTIRLDRLIQALLTNVLGRSVYNRYVMPAMKDDGFTPREGQNPLPMLFKISHARAQLSTQVHPNLRWAEILNRQKPRIYRDTNEKIEGWFGIDAMGVWIFTGFRDEESFRTVRFSERFRRGYVDGARRAPGTSMKLYQRLGKDFTEDWYTECLLARLDAVKAKKGDLFEFEEFLREDFGRAVEIDKMLKEEVEEFLPGIGERGKAAGRSWASKETRLAVRDEAVNIYHNLIHLREGEFALIQPRVIHAIVHGRYGEIQTSSDNTLRAANTDKPLDVQNLLRITNFKTGEPTTYRTPDKGPSWRTHNYEAQFNIGEETDRFEVSTIWFPGSGITHTYDQPVGGFEMLVCIKGKFELEQIGEEGQAGPPVRLHAGSSVMLHPMMTRGYRIHSLERDTEIVKLTVPHWRDPHTPVGVGVVDELVDDLEEIQRKAEPKTNGEGHAPGASEPRVVTLCDDRTACALMQTEMEPGFDWWRRLLGLSELFIVKRKLRSEKYLKSIMDGIESYNPDRIVVIGSSTTIDTGEYIASRLGIPVIFVPTVLTSNTMYSYKAHVRIGLAQVPVTVETPLPSRVVVDLGLIRHFVDEELRDQESPGVGKVVKSSEGVGAIRANRSGVGDVFCLYSAFWDWRSAIKAKRQIPDAAMLEAHEQMLDDLEEKAESIRDLEVSEEDKGLRLLERLLHETSRDAILFGSSHPQSGSEHILSDMISAVVRERRDLRPNYLHGEKVAFATLVMVYLQTLRDERLATKSITIARDRAAAHILELKVLLDRLGLPLRLRDVGLDRSVMVEALLRARPRQDKYTWFDTVDAAKLTRARAERYIKAVFPDEEEGPDIPTEAAPRPGRGIALDLLPRLPGEATDEIIIGDEDIPGEDGEGEEGPSRSSTSGITEWERRSIDIRMRTLEFTGEEQAAVEELLENPQPITLFPQISDDTYAWGGRGEGAFLPKFLRGFFTRGQIPFPEQEYYAEAWYGAHPGKYSPERPTERNMVTIAKIGTHTIRLDRLIQALLSSVLGRSVYNRYVLPAMQEDGFEPKGGQNPLPILFKISHAEKQLSTQVHPNLRWAEVLHEHAGYPDKNEKVEGWFGIDEEGVWILTGFRTEEDLKRMLSRGTRGEKTPAEMLEEETGFRLYTLFDEDWYASRFADRIDQERLRRAGLFDYERFLREDFGRAVTINTMSPEQVQEFLPGAGARLEELSHMSDGEIERQFPDVWAKLAKAQDEYMQRAWRNPPLKARFEEKIGELTKQAAAEGRQVDAGTIRREAQRLVLIEMRAYQNFLARKMVRKEAEREWDDDWLQAEEEVDRGVALLEFGFDRAAFLREAFVERLRDEAVNIYHNLIHLRKGQFALIQPRVIHAIVYGRYGEVQTSSDNTLRAANTSKPLDVQNLLRITNFRTGTPEVYGLPGRGDAWKEHNYEAQFDIGEETDRFEVSTIWFPSTGVTHVHEGSLGGFEILICISGKCVLTSEGRVKANFIGAGSSVMVHPLMGRYSIRSLERGTELIKLSVPHSRDPVRQVEEGIVSELVDDLAEMESRGARAVALCDHEVCGALQQAGLGWWRRLVGLRSCKLMVVERAIDSEADIMSTMDSVESFNPDRIVVIGGSTTIDTGEYIASRLGIPVIFVPTVLTTNTMYGYKAHVKVGPDQVPVTVETPLPSRVVVDLGLIHYFVEEELKAREEPGARSVIFRSAEGIGAIRANRSGAGDVLCLSSALWDWVHAASVERQVMDRVMFEEHRGALRELAEGAEGVRAADVKGLRLLERLLHNTSRNAILFGNSQPQSGSEHILSDMIGAVVRGRKDLRPNYLHGEKVALATMMMVYLQTLYEPHGTKALADQAVGLLRELMESLGLPTRLEDLGLDREVMVEALLRAKPRPDKYTWFDTDAAQGLDRRMAEAAVEAVFGSEGEVAREGADTESGDGDGRRVSTSGYSADQERELSMALGYMERLLPEESRLSREEMLQNLVSTNLNDPRRMSYTRDGEARQLPPTFIFKGDVFPGYKGKSKPRFIVLTLSPQGVAITTVFSDTEDERLILAKGGCRWYQVGQKVGMGEERIESMEEKFRGNRAKNLSPLLEEGVRLAESMYYKNPFWEVYFDGGKTIFMAEKGVDKEAFVRDWVASSILAGSLMKLYLAGPDTYMGHAEMEWIEQEKVHAFEQFGMPPTRVLATTSRDPEKFGTFPHEEWMATSIGVIETMLTALSYEPLRQRYSLECIESGKLSLAVIGFGDVGSGVVRYLAEHHGDNFEQLNIQLVGNVTGSVYCRRGLDKERLLEIVDSIRRGELSRDFDVREVFEKEIASGAYEYIERSHDAYFCGADIIIPAARGEFISHPDDIARMRRAGTKMYVEGANNSIASGLESRFEEDDICLFDGPIVNGGGIYASKEEVFHALREGEDSMLINAERNKLHIQGDIADIALANAHLLIRQINDGRARSYFELHREITSDIIRERARLLDNPSVAEKAEIEARVERDFARGVHRNDENLRILALVNATELAREHVMGERIDRQGILADLNSNNLATCRAAAYWAGKLRIQEAYEKLLEILKNPGNAALRRLAAISVAYINNPRAKTELEELAGSGRVAGDVLVGVEWALDYMGEEETPRTSTSGTSAGENELTRTSTSSQAETRAQAPAHHETPQATIAGVEESTREAVVQMSFKREGAIDTSGFMVIMKKDLPDFAIQRKAPLIQETLRGQYQVMKQDLRKFFSEGKGLVEVATQEELIAEINTGLAQGIKVIVLDDDTLTRNLDQNAIQGKAGEHYCVISAEEEEGLDSTTIHFLNLNAMTLMGLGVLSHDIDLFKAAYRTFTGKEATEGVIQQVAQGIIRALPRIVRFTNELRDRELIRRLFAVAA